MKRPFSFLLSLIMVMSIITTVPLSVNAASVDDLTFELNEDGESYSVTGCNEEASGELVIPDTYNGLPVTCIGDCAFDGCYNITMFTIGNGVTSIGDFAFHNCDRLTSIVIPDRVTNIGNYAFAYCESFTSITIPDSVTNIEKGTFEGCEGLVSITIPDSVTNIGVSAFEGCTSLASITIPDSVTNIEWDAFNNTGYYNDSDNWENGVLYIDNHLVAADETLNGEYIIKEGTKTIADYVFTSCESLTSLTTPDSLTRIGNDAFYGCTNLSTVTIGDGVTYIGDNAFRDCISLTTIIIPDKVISIGNDAFYGCANLSTITIGNGVTSIGDNAFSWCESLTSVIIPQSVKSIGFEAFCSCNNLTSIVIPNSVTSIADWAFAWCESLVSITIPNSITSIGEGLFYCCNSLISITIPDSVTNIGNEAFSSCDNLISIMIPNSVINIGDRAFEYTNLENVYYSDVESSWNDIVVGADNSTLSQALIHYEVDNVKTHWVEDSSKIICTGYINYICPCGYEYSVYAQDGIGHNYVNGTCSVCGENALVFSLNNDGESYFVEYCDTSVSGSIVIPDTYNGLPITSIGDSAFENCTSLTSITIPNSVESIGDSAFYYCRSLSLITIPDSVTSIGDRSFGCCESLTSVIIPDSVTSVGIGAFECCISLTSITIPDTVTSIGRWAFGYDFGYVGTFDYIKIDDFIIHGTKGSAAETYANDNGFKFVDVNHTHTLSSWITDSNATVYKAGSKHKECTECGEVLETAEIPQLKCGKPTLKSIENTEYGVLTKWGKVKGADKYRVYRKVKGGDWEYIGSTTKSYYTDKTAESGTKYYYAVRARNEAGNSSLSSSLSKYYLADPTLKTPSSTSKGIGLKWTQVDGAQGYIIYRKTGSGSYEKLKTEKGVSNLSYVDKSAKKGKKYTYKVKAYYSKTYSAYSNTKTITDKY